MTRRLSFHARHELRVELIFIPLFGCGPKVPTILFVCFECGIRLLEAGHVFENAADFVPLALNDRINVRVYGYRIELIGAHKFKRVDRRVLRSQQDMRCRAAY